MPDLDYEAGAIVTAICLGTWVLSRLIPMATGAIKSRSESKRLDQKATNAEYRNLLKEVREEHRKERQEWHTRIDVLTKEHQDCLQTTAAQGERIGHLEWAIERLKEQVKSLDANGSDE